jgi:hypothetical protein
MKEEKVIGGYPGLRRVDSEELEESRRAFEYRQYVKNLQELDLYEQLNGPYKCKKNENFPKNSDNHSIDSDGSYKKNDNSFIDNDSSLKNDENSPKNSDNHSIDSGSSYKNNDNSSIDNDNSPKNDDNSSIDSDSSFEENYRHYKSMTKPPILEDYPGRREPKTEGCTSDHPCLSLSCEFCRSSGYLDYLYYPSSSSRPEITRLGPYDRISNLPSLAVAGPSCNRGDPVNFDRPNSNNDSNNLSNSEGINNDSNNDSNNLLNSEGINNDSNSPLSGPNDRGNNPSSSENMNNEANDHSNSEGINNDGNDHSNSEDTNNEGNDHSNSEGTNSDVGSWVDYSSSFDFDF